IIESIRAGLVFQLKEAVGADVIRSREESFIRRAIESWEQNPNIRILGNHDAWRLSIVSFIVRHGDRYLHHNFVAALLNDLLGIQSRSGCSCAGPYGHRLLGIDIQTSKEFEREIMRGCEGIKPGWVRVNFNYFISEVVFDFIIKAVHLVADHGWRMLPDYRFDPTTGQWQHRGVLPSATMSLSNLSYRNGKLEYRSTHAREPEWVLESYLDEAKRIVARDVRELDGLELEDPKLNVDFEHLRWFPLPGEALAELRGKTVAPCDQPLHLRA
ncbi:MAG TPA: aminotransferase class V-fold PLP-dependent enzyme, partial [Polyangiaceae bacterium]|nr:aminotransferase class V-fold PLP-dependent enzyme [Polyangiaceae bacterium]